MKFLTPLMLVCVLCSFIEQVVAQNLGELNFYSWQQGDQMADEFFAQSCTGPTLQYHIFTGVSASCQMENKVYKVTYQHHSSVERDPSSGSCSSGSYSGLDCDCVRQHRSGFRQMRSRAFDLQQVSCVSDSGNGGSDRPGDLHSVDDEDLLGGIDGAPITGNSDDNPPTQQGELSLPEATVEGACTFETASYEAYDTQMDEYTRTCQEKSTETSTCCNDPVSCMMGGGTVGGTVSGLIQVAPTLAAAGASSTASVCKTMKNLTRAGTALNLVASNTCSEKIESCTMECEQMRGEIEVGRDFAVSAIAEYEAKSVEHEQRANELRNRGQSEASANPTYAAQITAHYNNWASQYDTAARQCARYARSADTKKTTYVNGMKNLANVITSCDGNSVRRDELRTASVVQLGFSEIASKCEDLVSDTTQDSGGEETVAFNNDCTDARNVNHPICIQCRGTSACSNPVCSGIQLTVACTTTTSTDNQRFGNPLDDQTGFGETPDLSRFEDGGTTLQSDPEKVAIRGSNGVTQGQGGSGGGGVSAAASGGASLGSNDSGSYSNGSAKPKVTLSERSGGGYSVARAQYGSGGGYSQSGGRGLQSDDDGKKGKGVNLNDLLGKNQAKRKLAGLSGGLKSDVHPSHVNIFERIHNRYQIKCKSRLLLGCDGKSVQQHEREP